MLDKQSFYHGVALIRLLDSERCQKICKYAFGFAVNDKVFVFFKYSTKARSPWGFHFSLDEISRLAAVRKIFNEAVVALICDGDGICAIPWSDAQKMLGDSAGRIAVGRSHYKQYSVSGSQRNLERRVPLKHWPSIVFGARKSK